ncbi:hypothetical protein E2C01_007640 [Portunus trituberculatus]|uniref:Uncharacterized protein n=1 Tax=Portunus trituberculatus TaxID=210409 RepID=A0A5B7D4M4_PORTR|nr:hypothetical protein [Portunus trituberculatus]
MEHVAFLSEAGGGMEGIGGRTVRRDEAGTGSEDNLVSEFSRSFPEPSTHFWGGWRGTLQENSQSQDVNKGMAQPAEASPLTVQNGGMIHGSIVSLIAPRDAWCSGRTRDSTHPYSETLL